MNTERLEELDNTIAENLTTMGGLREHAEHFAKLTVEKMVDQGTAIELTDDEERMLKAYRGFRQRNASGVFSWAMEDTKLAFVVPEAPNLIIDPRDMSEDKCHV